MGRRVQYWLAELDQYGNPTLTDGAHGSKRGPVKALAILRAIGLYDSAKRYAVARVELSEPKRKEG